MDKDKEKPRKEDFTKISRDAFEVIAAGKLSPAKAAHYLVNEKPCIRRGLGETIIALYGDRDEAKNRIQSFYLKLNPKAKPDSVARTIRNWLSDSRTPRDREDIFRIAFALDFSERELDYLLSLAKGYGVQYRDGRELVLAWFLRMGKTYQEALAFLETLPAYDPNNDLDSLSHSKITHVVARDSWSCDSEEALRAYYVEHLGEFGTQHARAYHFFEQYLLALVKPSLSKLGELEKVPPVNDDAYSVKRIVQEYMTLGTQKGIPVADLNQTLVLIKRGWPSTTYISDISLHKKDVPRSLILLLYVITENVGIGLDADLEVDYDEKGSLEDRLYDHIAVIDTILKDCGMAELDMRNAFDWLVLYAVAAEHEDEEMSKRFEEVVEELYSIPDPEPEGIETEGPESEKDGE